MTKKGKLIAIIVASVLILTALIVGIVLIVQNNKRENTQTTIMACSVNPSVHFVLNGNNKVVDVVALNHSGETLTINANFIGLTAEDAAKQFISLSTNAGYIDVDTEGTEVKISISGLNKNYDKLKNKVVSSINGYFDEKGIIAKATFLSDATLNNIVADLKTATATATDKSSETLMNEYLSYVKTIKDINRSSLSAFNQAYANYLAELEQDREDFQTLIDELNTKINDLRTQLSALSDQAGDIAKAINQQINAAQQRIKALKEDPASNPESIFANAITALQESFKITETTIQNIKTEYTTKVNGNLTKLQEHATKFAENATEIQNKIAEYRAK